MAKRAVFFDLGGTLLIMRRDRIVSRILDMNGYDASPERVRAAYFRVEPSWLLEYGNKNATSAESEESYRLLDSMVFKELFPGLPEAESTRASRLMRGMWPEVQRSIPLELYPDAEPTLGRLKSGGYKLALVSNAPPDAVKTIESLGLPKYISVIVVSGVVGVSKPNPEIFRLAMERAGVGPADAVHVGDLYDADVQGARNAGIDGVLLDRDGSYGATDCPKIETLDGIYGFLE